MLFSDLLHVTAAQAALPTGAAPLPLAQIARLDHGALLQLTAAAFRLTSLMGDGAAWQAAGLQDL